MARKTNIPGNISRALSERQRRESGGSDADAGIGGVLGQFFAKLSEAAEALGQAGSGQAQHGGELPFSLGGKDGRAVFGYTVRMGLDGLRAERFGDAPASDGSAQQTARPGRNEEAAPSVRAPIVDVFEEADQIRVVAEIPGIASGDVTCTLEGASLQLETRGPTVYRKVIALPGAVDAGSLSQSCHNGILEVRLKRAVAA